MLGKPHGCDFRRGEYATGNCPVVHAELVLREGIVRSHLALVRGDVRELIGTHAIIISSTVTVLRSPLCSISRVFFPCSRLTPVTEASFKMVTPRLLNSSP